jgi:hypothetical protein
MNSNQLEAEVCRKYKTRITGAAWDLTRTHTGRNFTEMQRWAAQFESSIRPYLESYGFTTIGDLFTAMVKSEQGDGVWPPVMDPWEGTAKCVITAHETLYAFLSMAVLEIYLDCKQMAPDAKEELLNKPLGLDVFTVRCQPIIMNANRVIDQKVTYDLILTARYQRDLPTILNNLQNIALEEM